MFLTNHLALPPRHYCHRKVNTLLITIGSPLTSVMSSILATVNACLFHFGIPKEIRYIILQYLHESLKDDNIHAAVKYWIHQRELAILRFGFISTWDTSLVTDMSYLFHGAGFDYDDPINDWDVSSVTDMSCMFSEADIFNQPLDKWNVSKVTTMHRMFYHANRFNQCLHSWDVSNCVDMYGMFDSAFMFNQPLNSWNTGNVRNMGNMFRRAWEFNHPLDNWDVSDVTTMNCMFDEAYTFNQSLNTWQVGNVLVMDCMFREAHRFNGMVNNWDVRNVRYMILMFGNAKAFNQRLDEWRVSKDAHVDRMVLLLPNSGYLGLTLTPEQREQSDMAPTWTMTLRGWVNTTFVYCFRILQLRLPYRSNRYCQ